MVELYTALTTALPDPRDCPALLEYLGAERREKTLRFVRPEGRKLSLGAGMIEREILSRHGKDVRDIYLGKNGKPLIEDLCFNLSHTTGRVVFALADREVGCDIERARPAPLDVAERFFCPGEQRYLDEFSAGEEQNRAFFRLWTMKESYMKMTGEGMSLPLDCFEIRLGDESEACVFRQGKREACFVRGYDMGEYQIAVCAREPITADGPEEICLILNP